MKCFAVVLGIGLFAATVSAQSFLDDPRLPAAPAAATATSFSYYEVAPALRLRADAFANHADAASPVAMAVSAEPSEASDPAPAQAVPVYGVNIPYSWQLYGGYTFFHFYEVPNLKNLENGFDIAVTYFPNGGWIGGEGDLMATFGSQGGCISKFALASGGTRVRWKGPSNTQFWLHGLVGGAHFFPQTIYGGQDAFGYVMGGGVDVTRNRRRIAYRLEVDAVGTRFFNSYQFSPKISVGIVFKF